MDQAIVIHGYQPGLSRQGLIDELKQLLERERDVERLICRYLADLADAVAREANVLGGHADVYMLANRELGLRLRQTRERIRIGRALRELPSIEQAFLGGQLSYSRTREVTRVAEPQTEHDWLVEARELPMRALERRVAQAGGRQADGRQADGEQRGGRQADGHQPDVREPGNARRYDAAPAPMRHPSPDMVELRMTLPAEVAALLERAMRGAKRASGRAEGVGSMSDAEALEAVARDALAAQGVLGDDDGEVVHEPDERMDHPLAATQGGSPPDEVTPAPSLPPAQAGLLAAMGRRRGWHPDALCEATGLSAQQVQVALLHLVLGGHVTKDDGEGYAACRPAVPDEGPPASPQTHVIVRGDDPSRPTTRAATQGGSRHDDAAALPPAQGKLLAAMGRRSGWHANALCEATDLPIHEVQAALTHLLLNGRIAEEAGRRFTPCR